MRIGDICKVNSIMSHKPSQLDDLVMLISKPSPRGYILGINLRTNTKHHYLKTELEKL